MPLVHLRHEIQLEPLHRRRPAIVADILHLSRRGWLTGHSQRNSLAFGWQKCRSPVVDAHVSQRRADGHKSGQIFVFGAQSIADPGSHSRTNEGIAAGVQFQCGPAVCCICAVHRIQKANVVHVPRHVRKETADRDATAAVLPKTPR